MTAARRTIIVFARAPEPGRVKTRLAAGLGPALALAIYRHLGLHTLAVARAVPDCEVIVCYTPEDAGGAVSAWLGSGLTLWPQVQSDLGGRMAAAIARARAAGSGAIVVVGTDCPGLDAAVIERAFAALGDGTADVVLGPTLDGGYYLLGTREPHRALFEGIPWSSHDTLATTLGALAAARLNAMLLDERLDVDSAADWFTWLQSLAPAQAAALAAGGLDPRRAAGPDRASIGDEDERGGFPAGPD